MKSALVVRITLAGKVLLTPCDRNGLGGTEDFATTEQAGIDREGAGPEKTERDRGRKADERGGDIETRQHGPVEWHEEHKGIAQADDRAANGSEDSDRQCDATDDQRGCGNRCEKVSARRRDGERALRCHRDADSSAQQQEAEACPVAWIVENASAP